MIVEVTGTTPLMMHNVRLADDQEPIVKDIKKLTAKKTKKTDEDRHEIDRLSYVGGLYHDPEIGPYMPAENVFRCLMEAGSLTRDGKKIERGLFVLTTRAPLEYDGPRDVDSLWNDGQGVFVDRRMVSVARQRIPRVRPIFPAWSFQMEMEIDTGILNPEEFEDIFTKAGRMIGLGDYRRFFGKFTAKVAW